MQWMMFTRQCSRLPVCPSVMTMTKSHSLYMTGICIRGTQLTRKLGTQELKHTSCREEVQDHWFSTEYLWSQSKRTTVNLTGTMIYFVYTYCIRVDQMVSRLNTWKIRYCTHTDRRLLNSVCQYFKYHSNSVMTWTAAILQSVQWFSY